MTKLHKSIYNSGCYSYDELANTCNRLSAENVELRCKVRDLVDWLYWMGVVRDLEHARDFDVPLDIPDWVETENQFVQWMHGDDDL